MKAIKMFGWAALTASIAMAFIGTTSTMAETTALCTADEDPCQVANQIGSVHAESVGKAKLLTSVGTPECDVLFLGDITTKLANPIVISGEFHYLKCALGGTSCTITEENGPAEIKVLKEGHETAKVTFEYLVRVVCSGFINCSLTSTNMIGIAKGPLLSAQTPDNGEITFLEQVGTKEAGGILCPSTLKLDIVTSPLTPTYISS